jgi:histidine kinase
MTNIINHLRAFSRQSQSDFEPVQVNKIIEDALLMIGEQLRLRNIETVKTLSSPLPLVNGDANKLEQVFLNLITNARDAIEEKIAAGHSMHKTEADACLQPTVGKLEIITRCTNCRDDWVEILIKDTGCGIPSHMVDKIFDPFFTTKEVGEGTGLGLSISYGIIKEHHADIQVMETGPQGTTVGIRIPACSKSPHYSFSVGKVSDAPNHPLTVTKGVKDRISIKYITLPILNPPRISGFVIRQIKEINATISKTMATRLLMETAGIGWER